MQRLSEYQEHALALLAQPGAAMKWGQRPFVDGGQRMGRVHFNTACSLLFRGYIVRDAARARYVITDEGRRALEQRVGAAEAGEGA